MNEIIESFLAGAVHVLMFPLSILFPNRMSISHMFVNSIIWGVTVAAALIALYDLRKRRRILNK